MKKINYKSDIIVISFILIISVFIALIMGMHRYGDSVSYCAMADSLIKDGDLIVDNKDLTRWNRGKPTDLPVGAYITVDSSGVMKYSKPILYPLLAAPFVFFGFGGIILLNGLFLGGIVAINYFFARKYFSVNISLAMAGLFVFCSFMPVYSAWMTPDIMLFFACCLCIWLGIYEKKPGLAAFIIGIVSSAKIMFLLLLVPLFAVFLANREIRKIFKIAGICVLGMAGMFLLNFLFLRQFSVYSGVRGYFFIKAPQYLNLDLVKNNLIVVVSQFDGFNFNSLGLFIRNLVNFFIGRFTGVVWYAFPVFVSVFVYLFYRENVSRAEKTIGDSILIITTVLAIALIFFRPLNYFGGRGFVCNRYFFILPALFFLPSFRLIKKPAKIALFFLPGLLISAQLIKNQIFTKNFVLEQGKYLYPYAFVKHVRDFPLKYAPLEICQIESFAVPSINISENISLYSPLGQRIRLNQRIQLDKEQEIVIIQTGKTGSLRLEVVPEEIVLQPDVILKNRRGLGSKSFYYFKAKLPVWIKDIHG